MTFLELFDSNYHFELFGKRINVDLRSDETKMVHDIRDNFSNMNDLIREAFHDAAMNRINELVISTELRTEIRRRIAGRQLITAIVMPCITDRTMQVLSVGVRTDNPDNPENFTVKIPKQP